METLYYFGTNLENAGHFCWELTESFVKSEMPKGFIFDPYIYKNERVGYVRVTGSSDFAIISITGSPYDKRGGTVSVFFARTDINTLFRMVNSNKLAVEILKRIPYLTGCFEFNSPLIN